MRLIDAEALFKEFEKTAWYDNADRDEIAEEILLQMPTIDAVEVVRCKECKYYNVFRLECHNAHMNGYIGVDGFCSYGERKDNA